MLQLLAFGLAVGVGVQAWRNVPADGPASYDAAALVFFVAVLCAYLGGRWDGRGRGARASAYASAEATATATAQQQVNVAVVVPGAGARPSFGLPSETAPWLLEAQERHELTSDQLDGLEVAEILEREEVL